MFFSPKKNYIISVSLPFLEEPQHKPLLPQNKNAPILHANTQPYLLMQGCQILHSFQSGNRSLCEYFNEDEQVNLYPLYEHIASLSFLPEKHAL
jgi:hypothetical protein